ncbi:hypothetical protein LINPERPRIM_LOCUS21050 [Linum perenne]
MESSSNASQRVATSNMATPHLDDTLTSQANLTPSQGNLGGSPTGTASSAAGENAEEQMDQNDESLVARKRVRGLTRGLGLCKRNRREANKLKVFIDPMFGRALIPYHSVKVGNELGQIAPSYLWPIRKNKSVRRQIYGDVLLKLQGKLNIENIRDVAVQEKIWKHFLTIVRCRRQRCHQTYKEKGRTGKPSNVPESTWNSLCDYWNEEKVKIICAKNKANRSNLAKPHTEGPVCFVASYHEEREKQGGALNLIEFWKKSHTKKSGEWATDACRIEYDKMHDKVNASKETENPIEPDDAFFEVLGTGHGYIKGLGYGPTPPSTKSTYLESENADLREQNTKLAEENRQLKEKCVVLEDNVNELKARQVASDERQAAAQAATEERQAAGEAKQAELEKLIRDLMARKQ